MLTTERCSFYASNHYIHFYVSRALSVFESQFFMLLRNGIDEKSVFDDKSSAYLENKNLLKKLFF